MPLYNFFNWMAKALLDDSSVVGLRSKRTLLALELSVVFEGKVKLEDVVEWTKDGLASTGNQMGSSKAGAEETHGIVGNVQEVREGAGVPS